MSQIDLVKKIKKIDKITIDKNIILDVEDLVKIISESVNKYILSDDIAYNYINKDENKLKEMEKEKLRKALKLSTFGDKKSKKIVIDFIEYILINNKIITESNIDNSATSSHINI